PVLHQCQRLCCGLLGLGTDEKTAPIGRDIVTGASAADKRAEQWADGSHLRNVAFDVYFRRHQTLVHRDVINFLPVASPSSLRSARRGDPPLRARSWKGGDVDLLDSSCGDGLPDAQKCWRGSRMFPTLGLLAHRPKKQSPPASKPVGICSSSAC